MKIEISEIKIGCSELTGEVFAGKLNKDRTMWIEKTNITEQFKKVTKQLEKICPELEQEKIDFAVGFNKFCWERHFIYEPELDSWFVEKPDGFIDLSLPITDTHLLKLYKKHLENER